MKLRILIIALLVAVFAVVVVKYQRGTLPIVNPENRRVVAEKIEEDKFVQAYVELAIVAESTPIGTPEYDQKKADVLARLGLDTAMVQRQLASFNSRPDQWRPIWDKIQAELQRRTQQSIGTSSRDSTH